METGPRLKVSSDRLMKLGIEPATPGLQGKRFIHYTTAAPLTDVVSIMLINVKMPTIVGILIFMSRINFVIG